MAAADHPAARHLLVVLQPGWQALGDWAEIARRIGTHDSRIRIFITNSDLPSGKMLEQVAAAPTLVVSPGPLGKVAPLRGHILCGQPIGKLEQLARLDAAGVRIPLTATLTPETNLGELHFRDLVIVKPLDLRISSHGQGISLMRRERVRYRAMADYPDDHPGRISPMIVQDFIDTGPHPASYRVLMFLGRPLYCQRMVSDAQRVALDAENDTLEQAPIAMQALNDMQEFVYDADVIWTARAAARVFPEVPLLGIDILSEPATGRHYVLEVNAGGNTWHFSSSFLAEQRKKNGEAFERQRREQLDAFGTAATALVEATWALAK